MDGIDKLELQDVPEPVDLADDEVLVKISRVSLNNRDVKRP
jgi:NADPH:quinone reductase-like Zn-dependent oxidoreductase